MGYTWLKCCKPLIKCGHSSRIDRTCCETLWFSSKFEACRVWVELELIKIAQVQVFLLFRFFGLISKPVFWACFWLLLPLRAWLQSCLICWREIGGGLKKPRYLCIRFVPKQCCSQNIVLKSVLKTNRYNKVQDVRISEASLAPEYINQFWE